VLSRCETRGAGAEEAISKTPSREVMSNVKQALKAAKAALDAQDFAEAAAQAKIVLESDGKNYFGYSSQARIRELPP